MSGGAVAPIVKCKEHPDAPLVEDYRAGDIVCTVCGLVVCDRVIDVGPEWRTFRNDGNEIQNDRSRVGIAEDISTTGPSNSLTTSIALTKDAVKNNEFMSYARYQNRAGVFFFKFKKNLKINTSDRAFIKSCREMATIADRLKLPRNIIALFKQIYMTKGVKGRSYDAIASACLYTVCRQEGVPRTFKEICGAGHVSKKDIGRCFKLVLRALDTKVEVINSLDYMARFTTSLGLSLTLQKVAAFISKRAFELDLVSKVSVVTGVSETTIRKTFKSLLPSIEELYPGNYKPEVDIKTLHQTFG